ncbi:MAG: MarR family winged helix-turn-helix transcriptional regulator, partial [Fidelibacterota bacterium]
EKGITATQFMVLDALKDRGALPLSEIGRKIYLDKPAITGLADRLEKDGFVERRRSSDDRRVVRLHLTAKGESAHRELEPLVIAVDRELTCVLSANELNAMRTSLNKIWKHADGNLDS